LAEIASGWKPKNAVHLEEEEEEDEDEEEEEGPIYSWGRFGF
jgi:hypothetical protein